MVGSTGILHAVKALMCGSGRRFVFCHSLSELPYVVLDPVDVLLNAKDAVQFSVDATPPLGIVVDFGVPVLEPACEGDKAADDSN